MIISHRHQFVFIKTRKTAGTSTEVALSSICGDDDAITPLGEEQLRRKYGGRGSQNVEIPFRNYRPRDWARLFAQRKRARLSQHTGASLARLYLGDARWASYTKFAVERNPFDRVVSLFYWRRSQGRTTSRSVSDFIRTAPPADLSNYALYSIDGNLAVDHLLRYENLDSQLSCLLAGLGVRDLPTLPRAKAGIRDDDAHYWEVLDTTDIDRVEQACGREIALMGYSPERPPAG